MEAQLKHTNDNMLEKYLQKIKELENDNELLRKELERYKAAHGDISRSLDEFVAMQKLSEIINSSLDERVISESLLKLIGQVVPITEAAVFLAAENAPRAFPDSASKTLIEAYSNLEEDGVVFWLFEKKGSILLPMEDLMIDVPVDWKEKNMLLIPLICFNEGLGAVIAIADKPEDSFANKDFELLNMLGFQAATAFHHTRTFQKLKQAHEDLKKSQNNMVSTVRLAAVGELSGGVAHEINNPLQVILGHIQLAQLRGENSDTLTIISEQAIRISNIVKGLLNFVRQDYRDIYNEYVIPAQIIKKTYELIRGQFEKLNVKVNFENLKETAPVNINSNYLQQIFLNLLLNAKNNLLAVGGELIVETEDEDDYILIRVGDTGQPMKEEFIARVQNPFDSSEISVEPLQLGFAVSMQMIKDVNGLIQINSSSEGNDLQIHLPKNTQKKSEAADVL